MHTSWFHLRRGTACRSCWLSLMVVWALTASLLPLYSPPVHAASIPITIAVPQFNNDNTGAWKLNRDATLSVNRLRLTPAEALQVGTAFYTNRASLANDRSFSAYFVMEFSGAGGISPGGADGIVFTLQTQSNTAGSSGGGIGYEGITPSVGIEFDTWQNSDKGDTNANHVGLNVGGSVNSRKVASPPNGLLLKNNTWHTWVDYDGTSDRLEVRMNTVNERNGFPPILSETRDLTGDVGQDVFIGFTAATGSAYQYHDILSVYFDNKYNPIDTGNNTYTHAPSAVTLSANPAVIESNGTESATITAIVSDTNKLPVANQVVTFSTQLGTLSATTAKTDTNGKASVTLTGSTTGIATIRGTVVGGVYGETTVTIRDTIPPVAPVITSPRDGATLSHPRPPISGTSEPGSTVTVTEGGVTICTAVTDAAGIWNCTPSSDLSSGLHTITATASDVSGNMSPAATTTFTIDTTAPALPLIHGPANGSKTDNPRLLINGTAEPGSTVTVTEGGVTICTAMTNASGAWSCTPSSDLSFGLHTISATATDSTGNTSPPTAPTTFHVVQGLIYMPFTGFVGYPDVPHMH